MNLIEVGLEEWPFIAATLKPAITDPSLEDLLKGLERRVMQAWRPEKHRGVSGYLITTTDYLKGTTIPAMWITYVSGHVFPPVRKRMRDVLSALEAQAREWGCKEIRIANGRLSQWRRVMPGYELVDGTMLRKVL